MCGIVGICKKTELSKKEIDNISDISNGLQHRGPDQSGDWLNKDKNIFFSHKRLSIHDLTHEGSQPMTSRSDRYVIIFNGEAYNFLDIRNKLQKEGHEFDGGSDTEVILALIDKEGFFDAISQVNGMFTIAIYDKKLNKILIGRDHTGQKPLYYFKDENTFFFTSEIRDIDKIGIKKNISLEALQYFFQLSYVPAPLSIYENLFKLDQGQYLEMNINDFDLKISNIERKKFFFDLKDHSFEKKLDIFEKVFDDVAKDHLISDVNNGTLLSGGVDSTLVTHFANRVSNNKINSYCVKSNDVNFDESLYAEKIAKKIGTNHHTLEFSKKDLFDTITNIHKVYDEPFGDSSQIPTYLLFKSIKENIKVALSGDGGDEIFLGYNRYQFLNDNYRFLKGINLSIRKKFSNILNFFPEKTYDKLNNLFKFNYVNLGNKISKISNSLSFKNSKEFYFQIVRQDHDFDNIVNTEKNSKKNFLDKINFLDKDSELKNFQMTDIKTYLVDDIFVKVDRASMHNSIESRAPFVDNRIIDFSDSLSEYDKIRKNKPKYFLKKYLERHFSTSDFDRPKMGFGNPIGTWLNYELKDWAENLINEDNEKIKKYINIELIKNIWFLHQQQKKDYSNILWNFIMFKQWFSLNEIN